MGKAIARVRERHHVQSQVQRAPGRLTARALNPEFSAGGKGPRRREVGEGKGYRTRNVNRLGKSLDPPKLEVAGWSEWSGLLDEWTTGTPDSPP